MDFYIDWSKKEIGFSNSAKTAIGFHADSRGRPETRPGIIVANQIRLSIKFNNAGQLYNSFAEIRDATSTPGRLAVIGFIGQEGVVAAFVDRENGGGAGGFTASNPDHSTYVPAFVEADVNDAETDGDGNSSLVNYEDWVDSGARPAAAPSAPSISEFLQTTTFTDNKRGFANLTNGVNAQIGDFNSNTNFRSPLLKGDAKNGFALHTTAGNHYAGVLHTADLGAPIIQTSGSAVWRGYLSAQYSVISQNAQGASVATTAVTHALFDLTVKFSTSHDGQAGELSGTVIRDINVASSGLLYTIEGRFNARGAISGTIARTEGLVEAPLSGIIGQKGAIGVFASNVADNKFAGGFVARPSSVVNVNYDVWARSTPLTTGGLEATPKAYNHWLAGGVAGAAGGINGQSRAGITDGSLSNLNLVTGIVRLSDATYKLAPLGGSPNNGVAFYTGVNASVNRRQFYSGLFAQTDLGKPVARTSGQAHWVGQLVARQHIGGAIHHRYGDIVLRVNFTPTGGTIAGSLHANPLTSPGYSYDLANVTFNEDGFVRGNVNTRTTSGGREEGFLTGLIGEQGVVGSFIAPNVAGGFVAVPGRPSGAGGTYTDWLYHTQVRGEAFTHLPHNVTGRLNEILVTDPSDPNHNISYGNSRSDDGRDRIAVGVEDAWSGQVPTGLTGGYSALYTLWNPSNGLSQAHSSLHRAYHAGIHPDTNVGGVPPHIPLGVSGVVATWKGRMNIIGSRTFKYAGGSPIDITEFDNQEFQIQVNFNSNRLNTPNHRAERNPIGGYFHGLEASWDDRGILTGTIENSHSDYPNARISGLIGTGGAVAVIISDFNRHYGYAGGFIACPTHNFGGTGNCK